ncbi:low molecular weight protein-tyrosine-phosphatase [Psychrobium sp. 1_MG-2023]|uniref:low molecular weight protein-tyrosine-phosphatase n=1 Tax=Psychrobium sp. 1_MG-2023 TaxID=3062624 RepID=UPI002733D82C|nr:low molecular weight protein-tyrosine-phosphatase [Psychrobium sp. 1_MG-2023]MDP2562218.1 low molecular weight protein-tyrosine-phosphatase [Psychrobium sp. 1_MG-2023]
MVCMGNICRSPTAEAVLKKKLDQQEVAVTVDSAGTIAFHQGKKPDPRSMMVAEAKGYSFKGMRSRPVVDQDFHDFDFILAMDEDNERELLSRCPKELQYKIQLLLNFRSACDDAVTTEVPDPYYGGSKGFDLVLALIEQGCDGLIEHLQLELKNKRDSG